MTVLSFCGQISFNGKMNLGHSMSFESWLAFVAASTVLLLIPGPTVLMVISFGISQGRRAVTASTLGVMLGDFIAITASLAGLAALLAASSLLFLIMKYLGAAYLMYLGVKMWLARDEAPEQFEVPAVSSFKIFRDTFLVTVMNPKAILFFVAFLPQFIVPAQPVLLQFAIMDATFVALSFLNCLLWAAMAGGLRKVVSGPAAMRRLSKAGGTGLLGAGLFTALSGRLS